MRGGTGAVIDFSLPPGVTNGLVTDCSFTDTYHFGLQPGVSNSAVRGLAPMFACMEVPLACWFLFCSFLYSAVRVVPTHTAHPPP